MSDAALPNTSIERALARLAAGIGTTILLIAAIVAGSICGSALNNDPAWGRIGVEN